jgi:hypothetical protein
MVNQHPNNRKIERGMQPANHVFSTSFAHWIDPERTGPDPSIRKDCTQMEMIQANPSNILLIMSTGALAQATDPKHPMLFLVPDLRELVQLQPSCNKCPPS